MTDPVPAALSLSPGHNSFLVPDSVHALGGKLLVAGRAPANPIPVSVRCGGPGGPTRGPRFSAVTLTGEQGRYLVNLDAIPPKTPGDTGKARFNDCALGIRVPGFDPYNMGVAEIAKSANRQTIELRRVLDRGARNTISPTGLEASKKARSEYAQGWMDFSAVRNQEAIAHFEAVVKEYPRYAAAWFAMGEIRAAGYQPEAARIAYERSSPVDPTYVMPRIRLAWMATEARDWSTAARLAAEVMDLCPGQFQDIYFVRGTAELNLGNPSNAERFAWDGPRAKGDPEPQLETLLAAVAERSSGVLRRR